MNQSHPIICRITMGTSLDVDTITQFQVNMAHESEGTILDYDKVHKGVSAVVNDASKGNYLIASIENIPIGSLMLTREWSDWNNCWYWWVQSVYVVPQYRGKGVYRAMYDEVKAMAREQGVSQIRLYVDKNNLSAQMVYRRLGMDECHYLMYEEEIQSR